MSTEMDTCTVITATRWCLYTNKI